MAKLQITLTEEEAKLLSQKAANLGYDVTKYAKFILAREAESVLRTIPAYKATSAINKLIESAVNEDIQGKTKKWPLGEYDDQVHKSL